MTSVWPNDSDFCGFNQRSVGERRPPPTVPFLIDHLFWQLWVQVWYWLSQEARQAVLSIAGHTRLHCVLLLEQLAKHASEDAAANRCLTLPASAVPTSVTRSNPPKIPFNCDLPA
jgi:hypothetical protein